MNMRIVLPFLFGVFLLAGCSGSGGSADGEDRVRNSMRASLGTTSSNHVVSATEDILITRHGYQLERRVVTTEDIRLETIWKELPATTDERALGFGYVRVRVTIRARPRDRNAGTYSATLNAEVEGRGPTSDIWTEIPITDERDEYLDEIVSFLENEFKGGVRPG